MTNREFATDNARVGKFALVAAAVLLAMLAVTLKAQTAAAGTKLTKADAAKALNQRGNVAQATLASYLERVKAETSETKPSEGSLWTENGRLAR